MDLRDRIMDFRNWITDLHNWIMDLHISGIILWMRQANETRRYNIK